MYNIVMSVGFESLESDDSNNEECGRFGFVDLAESMPEDNRDWETVRYCYSLNSEEKIMENLIGSLLTLL